jgi:hypothetical protein
MGVLVIAMACVMDFRVEMGKQAALFLLGVTLVLFGIFCEEKRQREARWRYLKKDTDPGIRTTRRGSSAHGGWE